MPIRWSAILAAATLAIGFGLGTWTQHRKPVIEMPAAAIVHKEGSITLERTPTPPPPPRPEPPENVARTRAAVLEIKPLPEPSKIQLDLVTLKDGSQRITAKGPALAGGIDYAVMGPQPVKKWTLGATWDGKEYGGILFKSSGPWIYGIELQHSRAAVMVGFHF